jgi:hypothetical protein
MGGGSQASFGAVGGCSGHCENNGERIEVSFGQVGGGKLLDSDLKRILPSFSDRRQRLAVEMEARVISERVQQELVERLTTMEQQWEEAKVGREEDRRERQRTPKKLKVTLSC